MSSVRASILDRFVPEDIDDEAERLKREYNASAVAEGFDPKSFQLVRKGGSTNYENENEWKYFASDPNLNFTMLWQPVATGIGKLSDRKTRYVVLHSQTGQRLSSTIALSGRHSRNVNAFVSLEAFRFIQAAWESDIPKSVMRKLVMAHKRIGTHRITCEHIDRKRREFLLDFGFKYDVVKNLYIDPRSEEY
jgi:hypothetical protein